jgi:hypothetical protein
MTLRDFETERFNARATINHRDAIGRLPEGLASQLDEARLTSATDCTGAGAG